MPESEMTQANVLGLRVGEVVEVRSEREILAMLDERGELDGLPFMPEMLRFCGRRLTVHKLAIKLCDTITWTGIYRMTNAVHLQGLRCDDQANGGCQAGACCTGKRPGSSGSPPTSRTRRPATQRGRPAGPHRSLPATAGLWVGARWRGWRGRRARRGGVRLPGDRAAAGGAHPGAALACDLTWRGRLRCSGCL
jgi:hypothetical protein